MISERGWICLVAFLGIILLLCSLKVFHVKGGLKGLPLGQKIGQGWHQVVYKHQNRDLVLKVHNHHHLNVFEYFFWRSFARSKLAQLQKNQALINSSNNFAKVHRINQKHLYSVWECVDGEHLSSLHELSASQELQIANLDIFIFQMHSPSE